MKERQARLKTIKRLIKSRRVASQEELQNFLAAEGYSVTQATLSRDLKLLKVGKVSEAQGYYYTLPDEEDEHESIKSYVQDFQRGYVSIEFSHNLGVVRTLGGHANSVALAIDNLGMDEVIGTIAGDDTVFLVLREGIPGSRVVEKLREKIPDLEE